LDFIQLIANLKKTGMNVHGIIAGEADPKKAAFLQELQTKIAELNLNYDISFIGHRTDLKDVMSVSNLVLSLSQEPEAFGRTTPEALSLGVPVVGYNHGGVGEVLSKMFPAGLVPLGDLDMLEQSVLDCLRHPSNIAENLKFTLANMQTHTLTTYHELAIND
jgi:glycosyltransferase involved in cell wall biosynthesis